MSALPEASALARALDRREAGPGGLLLVVAVAEGLSVWVSQDHMDHDRILVEVWSEQEPERWFPIGARVELDAMRTPASWTGQEAVLETLLGSAVASLVTVAQGMERPIPASRVAGSSTSADKVRPLFGHRTAP